MTATEDGDSIDEFIAQWGRERPEIDPSPMAVVARIHRIGALLDTALRPPFEAAGLSGGEFDVLAALRRSGPPYRLSASDLAASMVVSSGGATKRVDRLVRAGLVQRTVSEHDARGRVIELTEAGSAKVDEVVTAHWANEKRLIAALDGAEQDQLVGLLRKLLLSLE